MDDDDVDVEVSIGDAFGFPEEFVDESSVNVPPIEVVAPWSGNLGNGANAVSKGEKIVKACMSVTS